MALNDLRPGPRTRLGRTFTSLEALGVTPLFAQERGQALATVLRLIPKGAAVAHGTSTTRPQAAFQNRTAVLFFVLEITVGTDRKGPVTLQ